jgi:hypothetical protein
MSVTQAVVASPLIHDTLADQSAATIYEAKDIHTGLTYALKVPKTNCQTADAFAILQNVSHSGIIPVAEGSQSKAQLVTEI